MDDDLNKLKKSELIELIKKMESGLYSVEKEVLSKENCKLNKDINLRNNRIRLLEEIHIKYMKLLYIIEKRRFAVGWKIAELREEETSIKEDITELEKEL